MRLRFAFTLLGFLCAGMVARAQSSAPAPTCADLRLVPAPRECTAVKMVPIGATGLRVLFEKNSEDEVATRDLEQWLSDRGVRHGVEGSPVIRFEKVSESRARELFANPD